LIFNLSVPFVAVEIADARWRCYGDAADAARREI
jgi:hypothetical protein